MHVGTGILFQNPLNEHPDVEVYQNELALADLVEPLGFDSIWGVEHHFTDYTMSPDVLQFLTYMAGRTRAIRLGSMVVVLPWHDPIRVAEQVSILDHVSGGRLIFGIGRGHVGCDSFVGVFSYAAMPYDAAEKSMRLFAREVMPELKKVGAPERRASAA